MNNIRDDYQISYTDKEIQYAVLGLMLLPLYIKLMSQLSAIISFPTVITTVLYYGCIWLFIVKYAVNNLKSFIFNLAQIGILLLIFSVFCCVMGNTGTEFIFRYNIQEIVTFQPTTLFFTAMYMILGISIQDYDSFSLRLHVVSKIGVIFGLLIYCFGLISGNILYYDDMNYAYALCLLVCCLLAGYTKNDLPYVVIGVLCLLLAGTRGPLICITVAFLLRSFMGEKNIQTILGRVLFCIIALVSLYSGVLTWVLEKLMGLMGGFGITQLRILDYMNNGMLLDSSGRDGFSDIIKEAIRERPVLGYGIGADRSLLPLGRYCHNIILEVLVSLGVILGSIVLLWIFYRVLKMLTSKKESYKVIAIAFLSGEIIKLFLSSTILQSELLFVFLGMSIVATGRIKWRNPVSGITGELNEHTE